VACAVGPLIRRYCCLWYFASQYERIRILPDCRYTTAYISVDRRCCRSFSDVNADFESRPIPYLLNNSTTQTIASIEYGSIVIYLLVGNYSLSFFWLLGWLICGNFLKKLSWLICGWWVPPLSLSRSWWLFWSQRITAGDSLFRLSGSFNSVLYERVFRQRTSSL
jgi:hypothetical protein